MFTLAYRIKYVDHMDVTIEYTDESEARAAFDNTKEYANLKFVRLEKDGETVDYFRP